MIPPNELESFRTRLVGVQRQFRRNLAIELGHETLRSFANYLYTKVDLYETALSDDSTEALAKNYRNAVSGLISRAERLAGAVKELAELVEHYRKPERPGEAPGARSDLAAHADGLAGVIQSIADLTVLIDQVSKLRLRSSTGGRDRGPRDQRDRPYWRTPLGSVADYRR